LKKVIEYNQNYVNAKLSVDDVLKIINNAPTVKPCENCDLYFKAMTKEEMKKGKR
jgi:hypothetical protein